MKQFWVDIRPFNKEIATTAIESGADAVVVDRSEDIKNLGRITTIAPDGDIRPGRDVVECNITDKESENIAAAQGKKQYVIVTTSDWTVIPLENLVAQSDRIIARVKTVEEAEMATPCAGEGCLWDPPDYPRPGNGQGCGHAHESRDRNDRSHFF